MTHLPPLMRDQRKIDAEQLDLLSLFHFVLAALSLFGLGVLFLQWFMMHSIFGNPNLWKNAQNGPPPPPELMAIFQWFFLIFGALAIALGAMNALSGWLIRQRRGRNFSLIVAALDSAGMPFGTALGVFTWVVLLRDSVVELYDATRAAGSAPPVTGSPNVAN